MRNLLQTDLEKLISGMLDEGIMNAISWLEKNQQPEGHWVGMLETNSCMEAEWILAMHFLGVRNDPKHDKVIRCILNEQRPDGSWGGILRYPKRRH